MLTRRGWGLTLGALGLALTGRVLGVLELYVLAAGAWALMGSALAFLALRPSEVEARRTLSPARVQTGDESLVELSVTNPGRRPTAVIELRDPVDGGPRRARLLLAPLPGGAEERANYRIPTERRGVLSVGPLEARRFDPLGLATTARVVAPETELVVYPAVEALLPLPHAPGDDRRGGSRRATATGQAGEDFYALRPWVVGDDLRQVHWPSTARRDELMVRQHDVPWQGRATVVLDVRAAYHDEDSLEQSVSAAASILVSCGRGGALVRLVGTDGSDSGFGTGPAHLDALLDRLARVESSSGGLPDLPETSGAVALVVTADVPPVDVAHLARLGRRPGSLTLVVLGRDGRQVAATARGTTVLVAPGDALAPQWNRAMASAGLARGTAG
ncbi:MAG: DUF58 domain-containing protein [Actinomycetota bacterium]|nr:DUF58 domain-containing protein [Actinomycetota bacterium]